MTTDKFIKEIAELVDRYPSALFNSVRIAQAILESDYGRSTLATQANNLFGIKASAPWTGEVYTVVTREELSGRLVKVDGEFRKYSSWALSVKDHAGFVTSTNYRKNVAYAAVIKAKTPEDQAKALTGTYATDSRYGDKLIKLIKQYNLKQYDKESGKMAKLTPQQVFNKLGLKYSVELLDKISRKHYVDTKNKKLGIVVHQTGAPAAGANARAMANYQRNMANPKNYEQKSWHYQVDDREVIQSFSHDICTWQSSDGRGPGNTAHISIEKCINADGDYNKAFDNLAKTCAAICYLEDFNPYRNIARHYDFARDKKWCPAQILNGKNGLTFQVLKDRTNKYLQFLNSETGGYNPQGLESSKPAAYKAPELPFKQLKVGDKVTLSKGFLWYDPNKQELLLSKRQDELVLTTDTIAEIKDIPDVNNSKIAYRLEKYNSWILEEYLLEPKEDWKIVDTEDKEDTKEAGELPEGHFIWNGREYKIEAV